MVEHLRQKPSGGSGLDIHSGVGSMKRNDYRYRRPAYQRQPEHSVVAKIDMKQRAMLGLKMLPDRLQFARVCQLRLISDLDIPDSSEPAKAGSFHDANIREGKPVRVFSFEGQH